jgi:hypothetical protein
MALTEFQRTVCRLIADQRIRSGESYVAGGTVLNTWTRSSRISRDIDLFHDTTEAVASSWAEDRKLLKDEGYSASACWTPEASCLPEIPANSRRLWTPERCFFIPDEYAAPCLR